MASVVRDAEPIGVVKPQSKFHLDRRLLAAFAGALLIGAASWYGYNYWTVGRFIESTDDAYVGADITDIAPKVAGVIDKVYVTDNQRVRAGDLLIKIDDRDFRAKLAQAEASIAAQRAVLANLEANRKLQLAVIDQARADDATATAEIARTRFDIDRYKELSQREFASVQRYQQADADHKKAIAGGSKSRAAIEAATRKLDVIDTQKQQTEAAIAQAESERDLARINLDYTEIRAPIDGVVGNRGARSGAFASVGAQLLSLVPVDGLWVDANFKESQLAHMREGQGVTIVADIFPGETFHGHVTSLAPATGAKFSVLPAENATGNFTKIVQRVPVRVALDGEAAKLGRLRPGLSVVASVDQR